LSQCHRIDRSKEAVQTSLDKLEGRLYTLGIDGERQAITDTLKARRPGTWGNNSKSGDDHTDEAVQTSLDKLEGRLYTLGIDGERQAITDTLKARRPEVWGNNSKSDEHTSGPQMAS
jgi:hypothetical protein